MSSYQGWRHGSLCALHGVCHNCQKWLRPACVRPHRPSRRGRMSPSTGPAQRIKPWSTCLFPAPAPDAGRAVVPGPYVALVVAKRAATRCVRRQMLASAPRSRFKTGLVVVGACLFQALGADRRAARDRRKAQPSVFVAKVIFMVATGPTACQAGWNMDGPTPG